MKIPRARQDADVAGVAEFLGGIVRMLARIVLQGFEWAGRHRLATEAAIGNADQIGRAIE